MAPVAARDDAARGQDPECPAHGLKRHSEVFTNIRPLHREIYLRRAFTSGGLKVFHQLKEHRNSGESSPPSKEKCVTLGLTEFVHKLADQVEFQVGIFRQSALQSGQRKPIQRQWRERPGGVYVSSFLG